MAYFKVGIGEEYDLKHFDRFSYKELNNDRSCIQKIKECKPFKVKDKFILPYSGVLVSNQDFASKDMVGCTTLNFVNSLVGKDKTSSIFNKYLFVLLDVYSQTVLIIPKKYVSLLSVEIFELIKDPKVYKLGNNLIVKSTSVDPYMKVCNEVVVMFIPYYFSMAMKKYKGWTTNMQRYEKMLRVYISKNSRSRAVERVASCALDSVNTSALWCLFGCTKVGDVEFIRWLAEKQLDAYVDFQTSAKNEEIDDFDYYDYAYDHVKVEREEVETKSDDSGDHRDEHSQHDDPGENRDENASGTDDYGAIHVAT